MLKRCSGPKCSDTIVDFNFDSKGLFTRRGRQYIEVSENHVGPAFCGIVCEKIYMERKLKDFDETEHDAYFYPKEIPKF